MPPFSCEPKAALSLARGKEEGWHTYPLCSAGRLFLPSGLSYNQSLPSVLAACIQARSLFSFSFSYPSLFSYLGLFLPHFSYLVCVTSFCSSTVNCPWPLRPPSLPFNSLLSGVQGTAVRKTRIPAVHMTSATPSAANQLIYEDLSKHNRGGSRPPSSST